jgi:thioredoxin reductase (NADPH)
MYHQSQSYSALIIGGGPAGASCALWLKMLGYNPAIVEKSGALGGLQKESPYLNNWVLGQHEVTGERFARKLHEQIESLDIPIFFNACPERFEREPGNPWKVLLTGPATHEEIQADYLVVATGVRPRTCGFMEGESVLVGPGKKVNDHDFRKKRVAILGGGDNAFENFSFIRGKGAREVHIFARHVRARLEFRSRVPQDCVTTGNYFADQRTMSVNGDRFDTIVVLCGWGPVNPLVGRIPLTLDKQGFISTDENRKTSNSTIYAIGEVTCKSHPCVVTSMADGVVCAKDIQKRMDTKSSSFAHKGFTLPEYA